MPWRRPMRVRIWVAAACIALWAVAIQARLVYLQVVQPRRARRQGRSPADAHDRGAGQARRDRRSQRPRAGLRAWTPTRSTPFRPRSATRRAAAAALCRALGDCSGQGRARARRPACASGKAFAYVRRQASPEQARRVAALELDGVGFLKESRRFYPNRELAAHLLGYVGIDNAGPGGHRGACTTRSSAARQGRCWCRWTPRSRRSCASSGRRRAARRSS